MREHSLMFTYDFYLVEAASFFLVLLNSPFTHTLYIKRERKRATVSKHELSHLRAAFIYLFICRTRSFIHCIRRKYKVNLWYKQRKLCWVKNVIFIKFSSIQQFLIHYIVWKKFKYKRYSFVNYSIPETFILYI